MTALIQYAAQYFTVSAQKSKIINAGLSPYYIFAVAVVGEHHIMPTFQDAQQNVNIGKQRCNFARFRVEFCCVDRMQ